MVSQAGAVLLVETVRRTGPDRALSAALTSWREARAVHDPGKSCWTWRSRWRWAGTAWPMSPRRVEGVVDAARATFGDHVIQHTAAALRPL